MDEPHDLVRRVMEAPDDFERVEELEAALSVEISSPDWDPELARAVAKLKGKPGPRPGDETFERYDSAFAVTPPTLSMEVLRPLLRSDDERLVSSGVYIASEGWGTEPIHTDLCDVFDRWGNGYALLALNNADSRSVETLLRVYARLDDDDPEKSARALDFLTTLAPPELAELAHNIKESEVATALTQFLSEPRPDDEQIREVLESPDRRIARIAAGALAIGSSGEDEEARRAQRNEKLLYEVRDRPDEASARFAFNELRGAWIFGYLKPRRWRDRVAFGWERFRWDGPTPRNLWTDFTIWLEDLRERRRRDDERDDG